ncbi:peptidylprolyl isomerase [Paenibacillus cisolokensis]|uniref:peptidylprolyl isomerase n=1 Tax=Paenibacillus cisolokensis TaxID=1658519 RepID=UPI003D28AEBF
MPSRNNKAWRTIVVSMTAVLTLSIFTACGKENNTEPEVDNSKVVVKYTGGEITEKEFELEQRIIALMSPAYAQFLEMDEFKEYLARQSVTYEYLFAKADDAAKEAAQKQVDDQIAQYKTGMGGESQFQSYLEQSNLTEEDLRNYMHRIMTVSEYEKNQVSDDEIKEYFEDNPTDFTRVTVRHVLIQFTDAEGNERTPQDALKLANEVKSKLEAGEDFAAIAKEYSEDPGSKETGGLYENRRAGDWVPEFKEKALSLELNTISDPVETSYGYHVMKVEARQEITYDTMPDEDKEDIRNELAAGKIDEFMQNELNDIIESMDLPKSENSGEQGGNQGPEGPEGQGDQGQPAEGTPEGTPEDTTDSNNGE